ncbi:MAG: hypothetical protein ABIK28_09875 [Planctomycetota bacterium]
MIKLSLFGAVALLFLWSGGVVAQDVVVNSEFEMQNYAFWAHSGTSTLEAIEQYDVTGSGSTWCWKSQSWNDGTAYTNFLTQQIAVEAGKTYDVSADFAFENC